MGNCCSSKKAENEFDEDLNTLKPGDARANINQGQSEPVDQSVNLDDILGGSGDKDDDDDFEDDDGEEEEEEVTKKMTAEQKAEYHAEQKKHAERKVRLDKEFDDFVKNKLDPKGDHLDADKKIVKDFDYFHMVIQAIWWWARYRYEYNAEAMQTVRREMLKQNNMQAYKAIIMQAMQQLNQIINYTVQQVAGECLGLSQEQFSDSMEHHMKNEEQAKKIQAAMQFPKHMFYEMKIKYGLSEGVTQIELPNLSVDQVLQIVKFKLDISVNLLKEVKEIAETEGPQKAQESQRFQQYIAADQFFAQTKIEQWKFDLRLEQMKQLEKLEDDDRFKKLNEDYKKEVQKIAGQVMEEAKKEAAKEEKEEQKQEEPPKDENKDGTKGLEGVY